MGLGLRADFTVERVMGDIVRHVDMASDKVEDTLAEASKEIAEIVWDLMPKKTGTMQRSIRRKRQKDGTWSVWINESQKVTNKNVTLADYMPKIENSHFTNIGKGSREKESGIDKSKLARKRIPLSHTGTYVGGGPWQRAIGVLVPRWEKQIAKVFRSEMRKRGQWLRDAKGRFV